MKCLVILLITLQFHYGLFAKLESKENQTEVDQQRSARVHRVSEYPEGLLTKYTMNQGSSEQFSSGTQKILQTFSEKLQSTLPDLNDLIQREAQLFKELNGILKELPREEANKLKNVDLAINEMTDISSSATFTKSLLRNANHLNNNLLNSPEELDIYHQDGQDDEKQTKPRSSVSQIESTNDVELKAVKNIAQYLDNVLIEIQNHITYVRGVFEKLCRKHHPFTRLNGNNMAKFASMNQPKKVSIL
ncbi:uncharacterized protein LOC114876970 isoform X2 [Osmia bicornis bicornis]|uniref:uncharacterized protein LOC114876970 isoform X2 n=1 Tax=Osmia bicornis bicornis TaxID=1437191 RepID=UPI001EAE9609|nr:uncharacterized protein LOC114876970 isoform X2 [Osmia bicornis bicornis]